MSGLAAKTVLGLRYLADRSTPDRFQGPLEFRHACAATAGAAELMWFALGVFGYCSLV